MQTFHFSREGKCMRENSNLFLLHKMSLWNWIKQTLIWYKLIYSHLVMDEQWKLFLDADVQLLSYLLWAILGDLRGNRNRNNSEAFVYYELFVQIQLTTYKYQISGNYNKLNPTCWFFVLSTEKLTLDLQPKCNQSQ